MRAIFAQTCVDTRIEGAANMQGTTRQDSAYRMTREGFMLLAMGFTGKEALRWKLAYIAAFNRMEAELQQPAQDPQRIQLAQRLATQAAAQVTQAVFDAVMAADNTDWRHARYLLNLGYDREGQPSVPHAQPIGDDQMIVSSTRCQSALPAARSSPPPTPSLPPATACTQRLTQRAQHREKQASKPSLPATQPQAVTRHADDDLQVIGFDSCKRFMDKR